MGLIQFTDRAKPYLSAWAHNNAGTDGIALLDPQEYPPRQLERDERSINMEIDSISKEIENLEEEANEEGIKAAQASSEPNKRIHKQNAAQALKEMDQKEGKADRLLKKRGLLLSIQHAREVTQGDGLDLTLDEVLAGEDTQAVANEIREMLVDIGMEEDDIEQITRTLDLNLPSGEADSEYADAVDEQIERLEKQQISEDEFDLSEVREDHSSEAGYRSSRVGDRRRQ